MTLLLGRSEGRTSRVGCASRSPRLAGFGCVFISGRHSSGDRRGASRDLDTERRVARDILLARATARPLARNDRTTLEDLAAPDAPRLTALDRAGEALGADRALRAEGLRGLELGRRVGEPQVRVEGAARHLGLRTARCRTQALVRTQLNASVERCQRQAHPGHPFL